MKKNDIIALNRMYQESLYAVMRGDYRTQQFFLMQMARLHQRYFPS